MFIFFFLRLFQNTDPLRPGRLLWNVSVEQPIVCVYEILPLNFFLQYHYFYIYTQQGNFHPISDFQRMSNIIHCFCKYSCSLKLVYPNIRKFPNYQILSLFHEMSRIPSGTLVQFGNVGYACLMNTNPRNKKFLICKWIETQLN